MIKNDFQFFKRTKNNKNHFSSKRNKIRNKEEKLH